MNETDLTKQIRDLLHAKGIWHRKIWQGPMSDKGISDIIGMHKKLCPECGLEVNGILTAIEVKGPKAKIRPEQNQFLDEVNLEGGIGFFAWSVEDVIRELGIEGVRM